MIDEMFLCQKFLYVVIIKENCKVPSIEFNVLSSSYFSPYHLIDLRNMNGVGMFTFPILGVLVDIG